MEEFVLKNNINVFYVTAESFPQGITAAHEKLHSMLPSMKDRKFFGISYPDKTHNIIYKAAVEELYSGEADKYGCETFVIRKGKYISETITGWQEDTAKVGQTFEKLLTTQGIDKNGYCLEMYTGEDEMRCMVGLTDE